MPSSKLIIIQNWDEISTYTTSKESLRFLISAHRLSVLGAPILKVYQDRLSNDLRFSIVVECSSSDQVLCCLYHGIQKILYKGDQSLQSLQSIAKKKNAKIFLKGLSI